MKKSEKIQLIYIFTYFIFAFIGMIGLAIFPSRLFGILFLLFLIVGCLGISFVHSLCNFYTCPNCNHHFRLRFFKDLFSKSGGKLGKKIKCPNCKEKNWMKEEPRG